MVEQDRYTPIVLRTAADDFAAAVRAGLSATPKRLPCRYFYDAAGSALFERICELPEYYLPRAETAILEAFAVAMIDQCPQGVDLVELGCGNSKKTQYLIDACLARHRDLTFHAIDIAPECLEKGARRLITSYDGLCVIGMVGEFANGLEYLSRCSGGPRLVVFLGSTIGNFDEQELAEFFTMLRRCLRSEDRFLLGFDLLKDPAMLIAAYDDARGVTAQFNLNILARINRELDADFDLARFRHRAVFNAERSRIEMHLESLCEQHVAVRAVGLDVQFRTGEAIHTENCYKHSRRVMAATLNEHGFDVLQTYADAAEQFCLFLAR
jgi:dimethylhistidine N-methyltransferase